MLRIKYRMVKKIMDKIEDRQTNRQEHRWKGKDLKATKLHNNNDSQLETIIGEGQTLCGYDLTFSV